MLAPEERCWVDAYHARVLAEVAPGLTDAPEVLAWLRAACTPL
jgi:Xaa-Pro aminopeptidase